MRCPKCKGVINPADVKLYIEAPTNIEVQLPCACGEIYSAWIDHSGWADSNSDPVNLIEFKGRSPRPKGAQS